MTSIIDILGNKQHPCFRVEINKYYHDNQDNDNKICKRQNFFFNCTSL